MNRFRQSLESEWEVAATLRWFESDEIKKTLDPSELESNLE